MAKTHFSFCIPAVFILLYPVGASAFFTGVGITGAAMKPLVDVQTEYVKQSTAITKDLGMSSQAVVSSVMAGGVDVSKTIYSASSIATTNNTQIQNAQAKAAMDFDAELTAEKIRADTTGVPRKEVLDKMIQFLSSDDIKDRDMNEVIKYVAEQMDGKPISVSSLSGEDIGCSAKECGVETTMYPSLIITKYAAMCGISKRSKVNRKESQRARMSTRSESAVKTQSFIEDSTSEELVANRIKSGRELTCTPDSKKIGLCGAELTDEEFTSKVLSSEIVPNGGVSAANFNSPSSVGGAGYIDLNHPSIKDLVSLKKYESVERDDIVGGADLPPIVDTYRNTSQLSAASQFADNIISSDLVHNQTTEERTVSRNSNFQAAFISRQASLSLARSSFDGAISRRRGTVLSGVDVLDKDMVFTKESEEGASEIDRLRFELDESMNKFSGENMVAVGSMNTQDLLAEQLLQEMRGNEFAFAELLDLERQALLLATLVAQEVNSPENIKYMQRGN